jgi:signal transduction histidine kinase
MKWLAVHLTVGLLCLACSFNLRAQSEGVDSNTDQPSSQDLAGKLDSTWEVGSWIWTSVTYDKQTVHLWRAFEIPKGAVVTKANLRITVDNAYKLFLDGRELGMGSDWRSLTEYDISQILDAGKHVLAVEGFNDNREAGLLFGLRIELKGGHVMTISSDSSWRIVPTDERNWELKPEPMENWVRATMVSEFLPRPKDREKEFDRKPTMIVKVPVLRPVEVKFWQHGWVQISLLSVAVVAVFTCLQLFARLTVQSKSQSLLNRERVRIARDIHDEVGARLTELALEGEVIQTKLPAESAVLPRLQALCEKARAVSGAMDEVVWVVNPHRDTLRDFINYACKYTRRFLGSTSIRCRLDVEQNLPEIVFELPIRRTLLLAVKEALNNAVKHSGADILFLRIHARGRAVFVVIEDNGKGFDLGSADPLRNGLTNMKQRMSELGGDCRFITKPGAGCRVEFEVPFSKSSKKNPSPTAEAQEPSEYATSITGDSVNPDGPHST